MCVKFANLFACVNVCARVIVCVCAGKCSCAFCVRMVVCTGECACFCGRCCDECACAAYACWYAKTYSVIGRVMHVRACVLVCACVRTLRLRVGMQKHILTYL